MCLPTGGSRMVSINVAPTPRDEVVHHDLDRADTFKLKAPGMSNQDHNSGRSVHGCIVIQLTSNVSMGVWFRSKQCLCLE